MPVFLPSHSHLHQTTIGPVAAATATTKFPVLVAPANTPLLVKRVSIAPATAVTGADTNTKHVNVVSGASTELSTLELVSGTDLAAVTDHALYEPASPLTLAAGAVLSIEVEKIGNGQDVPALGVTVEYAPK